MTVATDIARLRKMLPRHTNISSQDMASANERDTIDAFLQISALLTEVNTLVLGLQEDLDAVVLSSGVSSVFGRTGAVVAVSGDYASDEVTDGSTVGGPTVEDSLNALDAAIAGAAAWTVGSATLSFGASPGSQTTTIAVTGQAGIGAGAHVHCWIIGSDSTADNNAYGHAFQPFRAVAGDIVAATGFTITAWSDYDLSGDYTVRWGWSN